jgi:hypothetical protein
VRKAKLIAGLVAILVLGVAASARADILPVGAWSFNEGWGTVAHNTIFRGPDGNLEGNPSWTQGRFQKALSFSSATSDEVVVPDSSGFEGRNVTVSAWVQASSSPGQFRYIVAKGGNGCMTASYGLYTGPSGGLAFYAATSSTTFVMSADAGTKVWDGNWHSVVGTYDGSAVHLYVDGREIGSGNADTTPIPYGLSTTNDLGIGDAPSCPSLGFNGKIDDVKVFNRALGPQEIYGGYLASRGLPSFVFGDLIL